MDETPKTEEEMIVDEPTASPAPDPVMDMAGNDVNSLLMQKFEMMEQKLIELATPKQKVKKTRSEAQIKALEAGRAKRSVMALERKQEAAKLKEDAKIAKKQRIKEQKIAYDLKENNDEVIQGDDEVVSNVSAVAEPDAPTKPVVSFVEPVAPRPPPRRNNIIPSEGTFLPAGQSQPRQRVRVFDNVV